MYDTVNRLKTSTYGTSADGAAWTSTSYYSEILTYDRNGNIVTLVRKDASGSNMDDLNYVYNLQTNQLRSVSDAGSKTSGFTEPYQQENREYEYDHNGNLTLDYNKGITDITYNYLNLPGNITKGGASINYFYDAAGVKLRHTTTTGLKTDYVGSFVYDKAVSGNRILRYMMIGEGRLLIDDTTLRYEYFTRDHLGNTRLAYSEVNGDGFIALTEVDQAADYYPFGLRHEPIGTQETDNKYLYNGKELQEETEWLDYGRRMYDPALARWQIADPRAEKYTSLSPYNYCANNPILIIDPNGDTIVVNLAQNDKSDHSKTLNQAAAQIFKNQNSDDNVYIVIAHGNSDIVENYEEDGDVERLDAEELNTYLKDKYPAFKDALENGNEVKISLLSCNSGSEENGIASNLSKQDPNLTVTGVSGYAWFGKVDKQDATDIGQEGKVGFNSITNFLNGYPSTVEPKETGLVTYQSGDRIANTSYVMKAVDVIKAITYGIKP